MTRRSLFSLLAAAALDPERLLWRPGAKLISIPAPECFEVILHPGDALTIEGMDVRNRLMGGKLADPMLFTVVRTLPGLRVQRHDLVRVIAAGAP